MFLFRDRRDKEASSSAKPAESNAGGSGTREFLAVKAARLLGGAAHRVTASIAGAAQRVVSTSGPSAEALRQDLEARASTGSREELQAAIREWAQLLAATDDTPRYEGPSSGPLTFRGAFLCSRTFELALAAASCGSDSVAAGSDSGAWRAFLRGATLPGGDGVAADLPELLALTRRFPDCRRWVEEAALAVKADARNEQLRSERAAVGARAEELRSSLRRGVAGSAVACATSREALSLYATFRNGMLEAAAHLQDRVLTERQDRLRMAHEALAVLAEEAENLSGEAAARREELLRMRDAAVAEPRRQAEMLERDPSRLEIDERATALEEKRRNLQMQLEDASQGLAAQRDARLALLRQRESAVSEHRRLTESTQWQLHELQPAQLHRAIGPKAASMTEGEVLAGLGKTAEASHSLVASARSAASSAATRRVGEFAGQRCAIEAQAANVVRDHAQIELARLDAAGAGVRAAVAALVDYARSRRACGTMGLPNEEMPAWRDVQKLRRALGVAEAAWVEADAFWGSAAASEGCGERILEVAAQAAPKAVATLEASRARVAKALEELHEADPVVYELALHGEQASDDEDMGSMPVQSAAASSSQHPQRRRPPPSSMGGHASSSSAAAAAPDFGEEDGDGHSLPYGWEAHSTAEGDVYFYSLVTGETQWEPPEQDAAVTVGWRLFQAEDGNWFYHNPYDGAGVWYPELPTYAAEPANLEDLLHDARGH